MQGNKECEGKREKEKNVLDPSPSSSSAPFLPYFGPIAARSTFPLFDLHRARGDITYVLTQKKWTRPLEKTLSLFSLYAKRGE